MVTKTFYKSDTILFNQKQASKNALCGGSIVKNISTEKWPWIHYLISAKLNILDTSIYTLLYLSVASPHWLLRSSKALKKGAYPDCYTCRNHNKNQPPQYHIHDSFITTKDKQRALNYTVLSLLKDNYSRETSLRPYASCGLSSVTGWQCNHDLITCPLKPVITKASRQPLSVRWRGG